MKVKMVASDFVYLRMRPPKEHLHPWAVCTSVEACGGLRCDQCKASTEQVDSHEEAVKFFSDKGITQNRPPVGQVWICEPDQDDPVGVENNLCTWTLNCPVNELGHAIPCRSCPAHRRLEVLTLEEAVALWKEAKLIRRYR